MINVQQPWQPLQRQLEQQQLEIESEKRTAEIEEQKKRFMKVEHPKGKKQDPEEQDSKKEKT